MKKAKTQFRAEVKCLFCPTPEASSGEHLFSQWLGKIVPSSKINHTNFVSHMRRVGGNMIIAPNVKQKSGDITSRKFHVVCANCNNTWMSQIEEFVIPVMSPLILGESTEIDVDAQNKMAAWVMLKCIIGETMEPEQAGISQAQINAFYNGERPLNAGWEIWVGRHNSEEWRIAYSHTGATYIENDPEKLGIAEANESMHCNSQTTLFGLGNFFVFAFSTTDPITIKIGAQYGHVLQRLWPSSESIDLSKRSILTEEDMNSLKRYLFQPANIGRA